MATELVQLLRLAVDQRAAQVSEIPLGGLGARVEDMVIPTDDAQDATTQGVYVSFASYARHDLLRPNRLAFPDWLKVHRAGVVQVVCALVSCDFILPKRFWWGSDTTAPPGDDEPLPQRVILAVLADGVAMLRLERDGALDYLQLPDPAAGPWISKLYEATTIYLSRRPSNGVLDESPRRHPGDR